MCVHLPTVISVDSVLVFLGLELELRHHLHLCILDLYIHHLHLCMLDLYIPHLHLCMLDLYIPHLHLCMLDLYIPHLHLCMLDLYIPHLHLCMLDLYIHHMRLCVLDLYRPVYKQLINKQTYVTAHNYYSFCCSLLSKTEGLFVAVA